MAIIKEYRGKLLISLTDGKRLGEVKDIYLNHDGTKVAAVFLGKEGLINRKSLLLDLAEVKLFGVDAWLIAGSDGVKNRDEVDGADAYLQVNDLRGREIQTDGGTKIGTVGEVIWDDKGNVLGFALDKIHVAGPVAEAKAIARAALTSLGSSDRPVLAVMEQAERLKLSL